MRATGSPVVVWSAVRGPALERLYGAARAQALIHSNPKRRSSRRRYRDARGRFVARRRNPHPKRSRSWRGKKLQYTPGGYVLWEGSSPLTGEPIFAVATGISGRRGKSENLKTGAVAQTYIMRSDIDPREAVRSGQDEAICGMCPHRPELIRSFRSAKAAGLTVPAGADQAGFCYVDVSQAPTTIFRTYKRGRYQRVPLADVAAAMRKRGMGLRLGSYGDPAAVPLSVWSEILKGAKKHLGYTHQWKTPGAAALRGISMASVDSPFEYAQAKAKGWRTFRVRKSGQALLPGEIVCPASKEWEIAGRKKIECSACGLCGGAGRQAKDIAIMAHGKGAKTTGAKLVVLRNSLRRARNARGRFTRRAA